MRTDLDQTPRACPLLTFLNQFPYYIQSLSKLVVVLLFLFDPVQDKNYNQANP